jgi:lambda family phage tail tape measure protein
MAEDVTVTITADTAPFQNALEGLQKMSDRFGAQLTGALKSAAIQGRELDDVLRRVALNLAGMVLEQGLKPLQTLAAAKFSALLGGISGALPFANGGVVGNAGVVPFASGGVISSPSYFPLGKNIGLAGEAGPEAILPLQRSADGKLGVAAAGAGSTPVNVVFNVTTQDAQSFRRSEAQITGMLARAVSRGNRTL